MYLSAQKLNRRVTIQRPVQTSDSWGQSVTSWQTVCTVWAGIKTISGNSFIHQEFHAADTDISRTTASFRIRKRSGIDAGMRLVHQDRIYEIRAVLPDLQDNRYLDIGCAIGANEG